MLEMEVLLSSTSSASSEKLIEHIFMTEMAVTRWVSSLLLSLDSLFTVLIVNSSLFGIAECLIGVCNGLELFLGTFWIVLVFVGMELDRHLFEGFLDLILGCAPLQPQNLVIVLISQSCSEEEQEKDGKFAKFRK